MPHTDVASNDHRQYLENLLRISSILADNNDLDKTLTKLMEELLDIFNTDRAWLLYPCDPETNSWSIPVEATNPEYPGAFAAGENIPADDAIISIFNDVLSSPEPVIHDFTDENIPPHIKKFSIKTQMIIVLKPRDDKAWMLGMHQCTHHRTWGERDKSLFKDISILVTNMLTQRLLLKQVEDELHLRKQVQDELILAKEKAEAANMAKTKFLSKMSHELRTPMNAILGFSHILKLSARDENQRSSIHEITKASNHLMGLINELLDLPKIESGKIVLDIKNCQINTIIEDCISLTHSAANKRGIVLLNNIPNKVIYTIQADNTRFKQVILNLISNAIKYNRENGKVSIDYERIEPDFIRIKVSDTGNGLTEDEIQSLFMPFERLKQHYAIEGTGIGLVITKGLVEQMNGTIGVESQPNQGSTFWIQFKESVSKPKPVQVST